MLNGNLAHRNDGHARPRPVANHPPKMKIENLSFWYGEKRALKNISMDINRNEVTAFIGPSGCGKSTLLRCLNRTNEFVGETRLEGRITIDGSDVYDPDLDPPLMRQRFGWIAQRPDPFPWSIRENVLYGASLRGLHNNEQEAERALEDNLQAVGLWGEVSDRLSQPATDLSIGQQQRLCIARAITSQPEILLMDEPCSALDPVSTATIEDLIDNLRSRYTIVIVTHNLQQAARIADRAAFFYLGELLELGDIGQVIQNPRDAHCRAFVMGNVG